jgi:hypothetical protein
MEEHNIATQGDLATMAGVSPATISNGKKRGSFRKDTLAKIEAVIGPYLEDPNAIKKISLDEWLKEAETTLEASLKRFKGKSCPTSTKLCRACWGALSGLPGVSRPQTRAMCRLNHGWTQIGGLLFFEEEDGTLVREEEL